MKRGRPVVDIDLAQLEILAKMDCTNREMAAHFGVSERTIENRKKGAQIRETIERGKAKGNISLRRKQHTMALAGDRVMLIWLGKNRLGQTDKLQTDHTGRIESGPPPSVHVHFLEPKKKPD